MNNNFFGVLSSCISHYLSALTLTKMSNMMKQRWKSEAIEKLDLIVYTKIFLKFPHKFWPSGPEKEFFLYAHDRRGYYTFWQVSLKFSTSYSYIVFIIYVLFYLFSSVRYKFCISCQSAKKSDLFAAKNQLC